MIEKHFETLRIKCDVREFATNLMNIIGIIYTVACNLLVLPALLQVDRNRFLRGREGRQKTTGASG